MQREDLSSLFVRYLKAKGKNITKAREKIIAEIFKTQEHFDAADLWASLRDKKISMATIYRTLDLLVDAGLVRRIDLGTSQAYYEKLYGQPHHEHLICTSCGKVIEFASQRLEDELAEIVDRYGFQPYSHHLQVFGLCKECQEE